MSKDEGKGLQSPEPEPHAAAKAKLILKVLLSLHFRDSREPTHPVIHVILTLGDTSVRHT